MGKQSRKGQKSRGPEHQHHKTGEGTHEHHHLYSGSHTHHKGHHDDNNNPASSLTSSTVSSDSTPTPSPPTTNTNTMVEKDLSKTTTTAASAASTATTTSPAVVDSAPQENGKDALKALQAEKKSVELALVQLRSEFDEYRKVNEEEKSRLLVENEQANESLKDLLVQLAAKRRGEQELDFTETEAGDVSEVEGTLTFEEAAKLQKRKALVQKTWKAVHDTLNVKATVLFYEHLFQQHPHVVPLFQSGDMDKQAEKLFQMVDLAANNLDDLDSLVPKIEELGARHANSYHVERKHYDDIGETLLFTLKSGLGDAWTDDVAEAWGWVYGVLSNTMADAGEKAHFERRKTIVQTTWKAVEDTLSVDATKLFYKRLFEQHPSVIPLFGKGDIEIQAAKLYQTLALAVSALDDIDALVPTLEELGVKHAVEYHAERPHYDAVGESLLWTLQSGLGDAWNDETKDAWVWVYGVLSSTMANAGEKAKVDRSADDEIHFEIDENSEKVKKHKKLVKSTWKTVHDSLNVEAAKLFYKHLFAEHPEVIPLFPSNDMDAQAQKLFQMVDLAVAGLDDVDSLLPKLEELGTRHANSYHAERGHYDAVGECLLFTLKSGLGDLWTDDVALAWGWVYGVISNTMAEAGEKAHFERRKTLVQETWKNVEDSLSVEATKLFYKRLFEQHPSVIPLFGKGDIEVQAAKLYQTLALAVESLNDINGLVPVLEDLGRRHYTQFEAERDHYDAVGECLLWTLEEGLGDAWTEQVKDAWTWVYGVVSKTMADAGEKEHLDRVKADKHTHVLDPKVTNVAKVSGKNGKSNAQNLEKSLFDLRLQYDEKVKRLEEEKEQLVAEKEKAFADLREILVSSRTAGASNGSPTTVNSTRGLAPVNTTQAAPSPDLSNEIANLEGIIAAVEKNVEKLSQEGRLKEENSKLLDKIGQMEKERDEHVEVLAEARMEKTKLAEKVETVEKERDENSRILRSKIEEQASSISANHKEELKHSRALAEHLVTLQHEETKQLLAALEKPKESVLLKGIASFFRILFLFVVLAGLLYAVRFWNHSTTAAICAPAMQSTRITEKSGILKAPFWISEEYQDAFFSQFCRDVPRIQLEMKDHSLVVTEFPPEPAKGEKRRKTKPKVTKHAARVAYVTNDMISIVDADGWHHEIPLPWDSEPWNHDHEHHKYPRSRKSHHKHNHV